MTILAMTTTGDIVGFWVRTKAPDPPPPGEKMGYPDPVGIWDWHDGAPPPQFTQLRFG